MSHVSSVMAGLRQSSPGQTEFYQAVEEVLEVLAPVLEAEPRYHGEGVVERLLEPERQILFRVAWVDDAGAVRVNKVRSLVSTGLVSSL